MMRNATRTGIDAVGDVLWGTHICHLYETKEDLISILVPYFKAGLQENELCMWITSEPLGVAEARASLNEAVQNLGDYIDKGQIELIDYREWYVKAGTFDANRVLKAWTEKENLAADKGFAGLRVAGDLFWLNDAHWKYFIDYETAIDSTIYGHRMIAICSYPVGRYAIDKLVDALSSHSFVLFRREGEWDVIQSSRRRDMLSLRNIGFGYAEIGRKLGLTGERVRQIVNKQSTPRRKELTKVSHDLVTAGEAAELLNVHVNTIRRWSNQGILPTYRIGSRRDRRFRRAELNKFIRTNQRLLPS